MGILPFQVATPLIVPPFETSMTWYSWANPFPLHPIRINTVRAVKPNQLILLPFIFVALPS